MIRPAHSDDAVAIHRLCRVLGYDAEPAGRVRARLQELLADPGQRVWVCERDGEPVGWLQALIARRLAVPGFVEIVGLAVDPAHRRQGIGNALVTSARSWAGERGLGLRVRCDTRRDAAHHFYRALGFRADKQQQVYRLPD